MEASIILVESVLLEEYAISVQSTILEESAGEFIVSEVSNGELVPEELVLSLVSEAVILEELSTEMESFSEELLSVISKDSSRPTILIAPLLGAHSDQQQQQEQQFSRQDHLTQQQQSLAPPTLYDDRSLFQ